LLRSKASSQRGARSILRRYCKRFAISRTGRRCCMASSSDGRATPLARSNRSGFKKLTRPGGQPGGSGATRGG
jgi:hypothetical protein